MVTFAFHCNIACEFCMVEDVLNVFPGTSLETFRALAREPQRLAGVRRIIFSGGEVTLARNLVEYVRFARSLPGVQHVRLQTNATRLGSGPLLDTLLDAGVDEFFVSLHAADAKTYDPMVQREGAFDEIMAGMRAIADRKATLITNTAIVLGNYRLLADIVKLAAPFGPRSMEFWNYWPRADEQGARSMVARVTDVRPHLVEALEACVSRGIPPVVKWFPRCLLGPFAAYQDDGQPPAIIDNRYWDSEPHYACLYEGVCSEAGTRCSGLSFAHVTRYGWEQGALEPTRGGAAVGPNGESVLSRSLVKDGAHRAESAAMAAWLARFQLRVGEFVKGWALEGARVQRSAGRLVLAFAREGARLEVIVQPTRPDRGCFGRSRSFDVLYANAAGAKGDEAASVTAEVLARIAAHDEGGIALP